MAQPVDDRPRGVLHGDGDPEPFQLARYRPSSDLAGLVHSYWSVAWDLGQGPDHPQEILPPPCVQLVVEHGASGVFGIATAKAIKVLRGRGRAFGIRFRPGTFGALWPHPIAELTDCTLALDRVLGERGAAYERDVLALADEDDAGRVARAEELLRGVGASLEPPMELARTIVESIEADREVTGVDAVAARFGLSTRGLQRLFHRHVGVTPKWTLQRFRLHEAVARLEAGEPVDLAGLAARLSYFDQAHFTREFTRLIGRPPGTYAQRIQGRASP